jgi:pantoate--beta-alanine ligase
MIIFHKNEDLQIFAKKNAGLWENSGFVPTMGALHEGHISLIRQSLLVSSTTVISIFVNPSQFNDPADFAKYPVTIDKDVRMLAEAGCDILFLPEIGEIYPDGWQHSAQYDLDSLETLLEGYYRPGHFQGVCQVVHRLLDIVQPTSIFMGQKDFQQCMVVQKLIELKNLRVQLHTCPTLREDDGLAMSSRNMRLSEQQRKIAAAIYREMDRIKRDAEILPLRSLEKRAIENLLLEGFSKVDYVSIAHTATLAPLEKKEPKSEAVVLVAAFLGEVRLIDNLLI